MATKDKIVFDVPAAEKAWVEDLCQASGYNSKIQMLRSLLDAEAARIGFADRPGKLPGGKSERKPRGDIPSDPATQKFYGKG